MNNESSLDSESADSAVVRGEGSSTIVGGTAVSDIINEAVSRAESDHSRHSVHTTEDVMEVTTTLVDPVEGVLKSSSIEDIESNGEIKTELEEMLVEVDINRTDVLAKHTLNEEQYRTMRFIQPYSLLDTLTNR